MTADTPEAIAGRTSEAVFDVGAPTLTVFRPKGRNTGAAMIVFPGGGFQALAQVAQWPALVESWLKEIKIL